MAFKAANRTAGWESFKLASNKSMAAGERMRESTSISSRRTSSGSFGKRWARPVMSPE